MATGDTTRGRRRLKQKPAGVIRPSLGHSADLSVARRSLATKQAPSSFLDLGRSTFAIIRSPQLVSALAQKPAGVIRPSPVAERRIHPSWSLRLVRRAAAD